MAEAALMPPMPENARTSLAQEEGCHRFNIASDDQRPDAIFLDEFDTDRTEFAAHPADHLYEAVTRRDKGRR